jgi:hypothetical protein
MGSALSGVSTLALEVPVTLFARPRTAAPSLSLPETVASTLLFLLVAGSAAAMRMADRHEQDQP